MKKYLFLGFFILVTVVLGAKILQTTASQNKKYISPEQLSLWVKNPDNAVIEINEDYFYVQEAIGSTAVTLEKPEILKGNFEINFQLMSLTQATELHFAMEKEKDLYDVEMTISANTNKIKLYKNKLLVLEKDAILIKPNAYYSFAIRHSEEGFIFVVNEEKVLAMHIAQTPVKFAITLIGKPNQPAAFEIRDMVINPLR